jgi:hypothetical protein
MTPQWYKKHRDATRRDRLERPVQRTTLVCLMLFVAYNQLPYVVSSAIDGTHPVAMWLSATSIVLLAPLASWELVQLWRAWWKGSNHVY